MTDDALIPYVPFEPYEEGEPRFTFHIEAVPFSHFPARHFLANIIFDNESLIFEHAAGRFILHGQNLYRIAQYLDDIRTFRVFDPARHQPAKNADAPIFRRFEMKAPAPHMKDWVQSSPQLRLLDD